MYIDLCIDQLTISAMLKETVEHFMASWGVDASLSHRGGVLPKPKSETPPRKVCVHAHVCELLTIA